MDVARGFVMSSGLAVGQIRRFKRDWHKSPGLAELSTSRAKVSFVGTNTGWLSESFGP